MAQNQVIYGEAETVRVTANANRTAGTLIQEGRWYGIPEQDVEAGGEYALRIRGVFEVEKADVTQALSTGEKVEFAFPGKVRRFNTGTPIGKVYETSPANAEKVKIILMPELY